MTRSDKLPAIIFYPGDWKKDPGIQALNFEERGIWFELLLIMHDCPRRGFLEINGAAMSDEIIGKILGIHGNKWKKIKRKLEVTGILSIEEKSGTLFNRRMAREEELREKNRKNGKLGGNPNFEKGKSNPYYGNGSVMISDNPKDNRKITPSISISSTSTITDSNTNSSGNTNLASPKKEKVAKAPNFRLSDLVFPPNLDSKKGREIITEWLQHKIKKNQRYKSAKSVNILLKQWGDCTIEHFEKSVMFSIGQNYSGIFPPRADNKKNQISENGYSEAFNHNMNILKEAREAKPSNDL